MDDDMANIIVGQLLYLDAVDPTKVSSFLFFRVLCCLEIRCFYVELVSF